MLHIVASNTVTTRVGVRKKGSSDDHYNSLMGHYWSCIGVDENRVFQAKIQNAAYDQIWLVGYFGSEATFLTNAVAKSVALGEIDTWIDWDLSGTLPNGTLGVFLTLSSASVSQGVRKNGSTDDRHTAPLHESSWAMIGVDENRILELWAHATSQVFYLNGYLTAGVIFNTNAPDLSLGSTGSWDDLAAFTQVSDSAVDDGSYVLFLHAGASAGAVDRAITNATLDANKKNDCSWCDRVRVVYKLAGFGETDTVTIALTGYFQ